MHQVSRKGFVTVTVGGGGAGASFIDLTEDNNEGGGAGEMDLEG